MRTELLDRLSGFDGRSVTILGEAEVRFGSHDNYLATLIALVPNENGMVQSGSTWLLKSAFERGDRLSGKETTALIKALAGVQEWSAILHICQSAEYLVFPDNLASVFADWVESHLGHPKPFVRAWSMNALCELALQSPAFHARAVRARAAAHEDQSASVKARARKARLAG